MGCVPKRAAGVPGLTSVSPVGISSGAAPAWSSATFLKGECHCSTNVFCVSYSRATMMSLCPAFYRQSNCSVNFCVAVQRKLLSADTIWNLLLSLGGFLNYISLNRLISLHFPNRTLIRTISGALYSP